MRGSVGGIVVAVCLLVACGGDDGGGGDGATEPDGGGGPVADGGGHDSGATPDARPSDASPDAAPGPVTVTVSLPRVPTAGNVVFFLRNDSSVIDVIVTGEDGRAQAMFDEPGVVVILLPGGLGPGALPTLYAYLAVPPGSEIFQGAPPPPDVAATLTMNGPTVPDATGYAVQTVCGPGSAMVPSVEVSLQFCPPQTHVLWTADFVQNGQPSSLTAFTPTVDVQNGTVTVGGELRPDLAQTARFTGLPQATTGDMTYNVLGPHGPVQLGQDHFNVVPQDGSLAITDELHDLRGLGLVGRQWLILRTPLGVFDVIAWVNHDGAPSVDVTGALPPHVLTASFTVATASWQWTQDDIGRATMVQGYVGVGAPLTTHNWNVMGPPDNLALSMPRLPPPYDDLNVEPTTGVSNVGLILYHHSGGYQRFVSDFQAEVTGAAGTAGDRLSITVGFPVIE